MRIPSIGLLCAGLASAGAQTTPRPLDVAPGVRLAATQAYNQRDALLTVGPRGEIITATRFGGAKISAYDSSGTSLGWSLITGRNAQAEIGAAAAMGWVGGADTLWVSDYMYRQVVLVDGKGTVLKSIEYPSWIHPSWADRRKYPVFGEMRAIAVYPDNTMLIIPSKSKSLLSTPGYDRSSMQLLRTTWDGAIRGTIAKLPDDNRAVRIASKDCAHNILVPFAGTSHWTTSPDGKRIAIIQPGVTRADSGTIRVTMLNERGDTVYMRTIPQPAQRHAPADVDGFVAKITSCGSFTADELRDSVKTRVAPFQSFLHGVSIGRDYSIWVFVRNGVDAANGRSATILDARGEVVGQVPLLVNDVPLAVDRGGYWLLEPSKIRAPGTFVRYNLQTTSAPPPRSGSTSAASRSSRPGT